MKIELIARDYLIRDKDDLKLIDTHIMTFPVIDDIHYMGKLIINSIGISSKRPVTRKVNFKLIDFLANKDTDDIYATSTEYEDANGKYHKVKFEAVFRR